MNEIECGEIYKPVIEELLDEIAEKNSEKGLYLLAFLLLKGVFLDNFNNYQRNDDHTNLGWYMMQTLFQQDNYYVKMWALDNGIGDLLEALVDEQYEDLAFDEFINIYDMSNENSLDEDDYKFIRRIKMQEIINKWEIPNNDESGTFLCDEEGYIIGTLDEPNKYLIYAEKVNEEIVVHKSKKCKKDLKKMSVARLENVRWKLCKRCGYKRKKTEDNGIPKYTIIENDSKKLIPEWMKGLKEKLDNAISNGDSQ